MELKESLLRMFNESLSQWGMVYLGTKKDCVYRMFTTWGVKVEKAHGIGYSIHPNTTKMYHDLQEVYKSYIAEFICRCNNCQEVEAEHQKICDLTQVRIITTWKGEDINMEFVVGLSQTRRKNDSIYVIVERLMTYYNFIGSKSTYLMEEYASFYLDEIMLLHGILSSIISYGGSQFTSNFWRCFQKS